VLRRFGPRHVCTGNYLDPPYLDIHAKAWNRPDWLSLLYVEWGMYRARFL
jgi:hypothetical protein